MASKGKKKKSLHDVTRQGLSVDDHGMLTEELMTGTDRSSALIGCAMVDATLVMALRSRFVKMTEDEFESLFYSQTAPLSSFSARIKVGRAIGIYGSKLHNMMDVIRRVRNAFAHSLRPIRFTEPLVAKECSALPEARLGEMTRGYDLDPLRERYLAVCVRTAVILEDHARRHFDKPIKIDIPDLPPKQRT